MRTLRLGSTDLDGLNRRGLIAISEVLVMLAVLVTLLWLGAQFVESVTNDSASASSISKACCERGVNRISPDGDGRRMWVYRRCSGVARLDLVTGEMEESISWAEMDLTAVAHSRDGSTTLLCGADGSVCLNFGGDDPRFFHVQTRDGNEIRDASVSHDGAVSVCVTSPGRVFCWSGHVANLREFTYELPPGAAISQIKLNRTGRRLLVFRHDGTVSFHIPETGEPIGTSCHVGRECTAVAWSNDERFVGALFSNNRAQVHDVNACRIVCAQQLDAHDCQNGKIEFSPDGRWIAVTTEVSKVIHVWNLKTGGPAKPLRGHDGIVRAIRFAPTSDRLYSGSFDGTIREWSLETFTELRVIN